MVGTAAYRTNWTANPTPTPNRARLVLALGVWSPDTPALEAEIKAKVCKPCWKKWEGMRVMVINEYQVNLGDESGRELVKKQMKAFLKLGEQTDTSKLDQNFRPAGS